MHSRWPLQQNALMKLAKAPKTSVLIVLFILTAFAVVIQHQYHGIVNLGAGIATGILFDLGAGILHGRWWVISESGVITGLIVAGVLNASTPPLLVVCSTAAALLSKHVVKMGTIPVFNPAALGLLGATVLTPVRLNWWSSFTFASPWLLILILVGGGYSLWRVGRFVAVGAYTATYVLIQLICSWSHVAALGHSATLALRPPLLNSALFLTLFMVTDPPTSPAKRWMQVCFGVIAATMGMLFFVLKLSTAYLLIGLLLANLWHAWLHRRNKRPASRYTAVPLGSRRTSENWYV